VSDLNEFFLYQRKSNGRKAVPRQGAVTGAYLTKLGGRVAREFTDADSTAFGKIDGEQPKRDGFACMLAVLQSRPGLEVAAWHADRLTRNPEDTGELIRVCAAGGSPGGNTSRRSCDLSGANGGRGSGTMRTTPRTRSITVVSGCWQRGRRLPQTVLAGR
jgi:hypothetical protein